MVRRVLDWLHRRDPEYRILRRSGRLTVIASLGFYGGRYGFGDSVLATYALFSAIGFGLFAQLPGRAGERARTVLAALPAGAALVALGSVLAVSTWTAAAGMLVIGFVVAFAGVGGPRLIGLGNALQLFYIVASFPPTQLSTLPSRLAGVAIGVLLLAIAEVTLWPDPAPVRYEQRLEGAADSVAAFLERDAEVLARTAPARTGQDGANGELARRRTKAFRAIEQVRIVEVPPTQRPTSASERDRALRDGAGALRQILAQAQRLPTEPGGVDGHRGDVARLLHRCATTIRDAGRTVTMGSPAVGFAELDADVARFEASRARGANLDVEAIRLDAIMQVAVEDVRTFATAARVAVGLPIRSVRKPAGEGPELFWYASSNRLELYWQRFKVHLTAGSVYFQEALRIAVALAAARVVAGTLNLEHGFWVLLATLTIMRSSAADTRTTLRPALIGTIAGVVATGLLLAVAHGPEVYVPLLPIAMALAFAVGPLFGLGWRQATITVLFTLVFAQLSPANWRLAGVRLENVLIGGGVGVLTGVLLWPRGGGGQLRRDAADYLERGAVAIEETVSTLTAAGRRAGLALDAAHRAMILVDASFCQYHAERRDPKMSFADWQAAVAAGHLIVRGAQALLRRTSPGCLAAWPDAAALLTESARRLRCGYADLAEGLRRGAITRPVDVPVPTRELLDRVEAIITAGETRPEVLQLVDVEVWLASLAENLTRIQNPAR